MRVPVTLVLVCLGAVLARPVCASEPAQSVPAVHEEAGGVWHGLKQHLEDWASRLREHFDFSPGRAERPLITFMLDQRQKLGLDSEQVRRLETIRNDFRRQAIRAQADLKVAEIDLETLLKAEPLEMKRVEAKIRDIEKIKGDLRLGRIRAVEEGKELLSQEQRAKLEEVWADGRREHARTN